MKGIKYILFLALLWISHAAVAATPIFGSAAESKYAREIVPPKGKAVVYIYQPSEKSSSISPTVWLNNYEIGRLAPGSFTVWQLAPGQLNVRVDGTEPARLSVTSQAGKIYLFRLNVNQTAAGTRAQLTGLPESYRSELVTTRLIKNPRDVKVAVVSKPKKPVVTPQPEKKSVPTQQPEKKLVKPTVRSPVMAESRPGARPESEPVVQSSSDDTVETRPAPRGSIAPGGVGLLLKTGAFSLSSDTQTILGTARTFDKSASGLYAIEAYYQFNSGLTAGGELLGYTAAFTTGGVNKHNVDVMILLANAKQYFNTDASLQPYIGAGLGVATTDTSGPTISGNTSGVAYQLLAGVEYRGTDIGVFGEFKLVGADTESSNNESIDASGSGFFAGVAFHF